MKKQTKKAFTLVELLVVIAILAVLATVGIVGYTSFTKKAKESNDRSVIAQMNTALQASEVSDGKPATMYEALSVIEEAGFNVEKLTPDSEGFDYAYDMKNNRFALLNGTTVVVEANDKAFDSENAWIVAHKESEIGKNGWSTYLANDYSGSKTITVTNGLDLGNVSDIESVTYQNQGSAKSVVLRTKGDNLTLNINAPKDDVAFYGFAKAVNVTEVASSSLHIYGSVNRLSVTKGHVEVEETGIVFNVLALDTTDATNPGSITNKGYIADAASDEIKTAISSNTGSKAVSDVYEISTLAQFEAFRDAVNSGEGFNGLTVKLVANITLKDGWKPIGEGSRKVGDTQIQEEVSTFFSGTFDGNGKTISNLNNKNFKPTSSRLVSDEGLQTYAYGLFALVKDATIKNLTLNSVDIDTHRYTNAVGDSVGALIGYSAGTTVVENIVVSGSVFGYDAVGGIIGRARGNQFTITGSTNNATVKSTRQAGGIAGQLGNVTKNISVSNCTNNGSVSTNAFADSSTGGQSWYSASGIANYNSGTVVITNCTNTGTVSGQNAKYVHEICNAANNTTPKLTVTNCTLKDGSVFNYPAQ